MPQQPSTVLLQGGMNMVSPPIAVPPGQVTAGVNYEPEVSGYRRIGGYERFDGQTAPSAGGVRANILAVPGIDEVKGVWCYGGAVYAFREGASKDRMSKSSSGGWVEQSFGKILDFTAGTTEIPEGAIITGAVSGVTATVKRVILQSGLWDGTGVGYMVVAPSGNFNAGEALNESAGNALITPVGTPWPSITISVGAGPYQFVNHDFGAGERMYFCNGGKSSGQVYEWDGTTLVPIKDVFSKARFIGQFRNHLVVGDGSSLIISGIGAPLDYRSSAGAAEIAFGEDINGFAPSLATSFVIMGKSRISYLAGNDSDDFQLLPIASTSGGFFGTIAAFGESPMYLDDAGVRKISASASFGDFRMGTITQLVEPLFRKKRKAGVLPVAAITLRGTDQYRVFFDDNSGVIVYMGRKHPEAMPFIYPMQAYCATAGEVTAAAGERYFVGAEDGFVYELNSGPSFDGAAVSAFIRLNWNTLNSPNQYKRFHSVSIETDSEDAITVGMAFDIDYVTAGSLGGAKVDHSVPAGYQGVIPLALYANVDFTQPVQGVLKAHIDGIGRNLAVTLVTNHTEEEPHTISSMTVNFSPRKTVK